MSSKHFFVLVATSVFSTSIALKEIHPKVNPKHVETGFTKTWPSFDPGDKEVTVNILEDRVMLVYIPALKAIHVFDLFRLEDERRVISLLELGIERLLGHDSSVSRGWRAELDVRKHRMIKDFTFFDGCSLIAETSS